jgi:hypothetical protein
VRRIKTGSITTLLDEIHVSRKEQSLQRREAKRLEGIEEQKRKDATKGVKFNTAMEESLAQDEQAIEAHMEMLGHGKGKCPPTAAPNPLYIITLRLTSPPTTIYITTGVCTSYLQAQFRARKLRAEQDGFTWPAIGAQFRSKHTKQLKMTPNDNSDKLAYIKLLVLQMMDADGKRGSSRAEELVQLSGLLRTVPTLSHESLNPLALNAKAALDKTITTAATQCDDPWLIFLETQYLLKLCFLSDIAARHKLYRVAKISYWASNKDRFACWEATLEPVHLDATGEPFVADDDVVVGPRGLRLTKSASLLGYIVAQYIDGDDEDPTRTECVDLYVEDALPKHRAYLHRQKQVTNLYF